MNIAKVQVAKLSVAFVTAAMLFTLVVPAQAKTTAEMIAELQAQLAALMADDSSESHADACTFTRALTVGSKGDDVKCLQDYLAGAGHFTNAGGSTGYFGPVTATAVAAWQTANGVAPAAGYFGSVSQAKYNAMMASMDHGDDSDDSGSDDSDDSGSDDEDDSNSGELSGEASLDTFEVSDGEDSDEVEEGSEDVQVAEFDVEFSDGDAMITRLDVRLIGSGNTESDPWDIFEEVSLWVGGEEVARMDASDEDEYLDEDDGSLRFTGLDIVAMEDEELEIVVGVSITSSVDDANSSTLADWDLTAESVRFVDADDVTTTDTDSGDLDSDTTDAAEFVIDEAGAGDDLDLETSDEDPESTTISLDEDDNTEAMIFAFDLSAEDSDGDVTLNEVQVYVFTSTTSLDEVVNDFRLEVGGDSYDAESYTGTGPGVLLTFDVDGDTSVAADAVATAMLYADFENMDEAGNEGTTINASTTTSYIDAEGEDDITVDGSEVEGETHTLRTEGIDLGDVTDGTGSSDSTQVVSGVSTDANYGTMFLTFEVTAFGDNLYVQSNNSSRGASTTAAVAYTIEDSTTGAATTSGTVSVSYDIDGADEDNGFYRLDDGETYEMTVTVNSFNPPASGTYNLQILTVGFAATEVNATNTQAPDDLSDYESDDVAVQS